MNSLTKRSFDAAIWNYAGNAMRLLLQFCFGILLARLLGPEAFGLVAIALLMIGFGQLFADFGFSSAIVQARELRPGDVDFLFTLQIALGASLTCLGLLLAQPFAALFDAPDAVAVIRWMSLMFVLRAIGQTSVALLSRELKFRAVQIGAITGYLAGYVFVGLPMAFTGHGVWSLVAAQLVQSGVATAMAIVQVGRLQRIALSGWRPDLYRFGRLVVSANIGSWTLSNVDSLAVGHFGGTVPLGLYNRAMNLAGVPMGAAVTGLQPVLFAATSRAQDNLERVRKAVLGCIALFVAFAGAVLLSIAATAETVTLALYGARWAGAVPLLTPLAIAMVVNGILALFGPALQGVGRVDKESSAQWLTVAVMLPTVAVAASISIVAVAWAIIPIYLLRLALLARAFFRIAGLRPRELFHAVLPAILVAIASAAAAMLADHLAHSLALGWRLLAVMAAAGGGLALGLIVLRGQLRTGPMGELLLSPGVLPASVRRWVGSDE